MTNGGDKCFNVSVTPWMPPATKSVHNLIDKPVTSRWPLADESSRRLDRLAKRAKALDRMIMKAAKMHKKIVEELRQIGVADKPSRRQGMSKNPKRPPKDR